MKKEMFEKNEKLHKKLMHDLLAQNHDRKEDARRIKQDAGIQKRLAEYISDLEHKQP